MIRFPFLYLSAMIFFMLKAKLSIVTFVMSRITVLQIAKNVIGFGEDESKFEQKVCEVKDCNFDWFIKEFYE